MTTLAETRSLVIKRRFDAAPERLYAAWTDANLARRWLFTGPHSDARETEMDARVGGRWTVRDVRGGVEHVATGEFLELDPPHRVVLTFGMPQFSPEFCRLIIVIAAAGTGSVLTLTQAPIPAKEVAPAKTGWGKMLAGLARLLSKGEDVPHL